MLVALALLVSPAPAAEVDLEGAYRARFRAFDALSLDADLAAGEPTAMWAEHRFWLRPRITVGGDVQVFADVFGLDGVYWGSTVQRYEDPSTGETDPIEFGDDLTPPSGDPDEDIRDPYRNLSLARAWAEVQLPVGRLSFGRMPAHWGLGLWRNDGLGDNAEFGDTVDRVQWDAVFDDVFVEVGAESTAEGLFNDADDTWSASGAVGYRTELVTAGLMAHYRTTPARNFSLFTVDAAFSGQIGNLDVGAEAIGQFGTGNLEGGVNDVNVLSYGGALEATLHTRAIDLGGKAGLASGDTEPNDTRLGTFSFDRDYQVGLVMFEQPMPVLVDAAGRDFDATLTGNRVSNALFLRPEASRELIDGVTAHAAWSSARALAAPEEERAGYGNEIDLGATYAIDERFRFDATGALFLPGGYYTNYADDTYSGFNDPVWAARIVGEARF